MRYFRSQAARELHPVSIHELNFPELCVDTDTRSYWKAIGTGAGAASWERLSGPLQNLPGVTTSEAGGYVDDDDTLRIYGRWTIDTRKQVDGRVVLLADLDAPKTVSRVIASGRTVTIVEDEQMVMVGPLVLNGRLVCNGNLAFA